MVLADIKDKLEKELSQRGLTLVWKPDTSKLGKDDLVVFGAEQVPDHPNPLIAGFGPDKYSESYGNSASQLVGDYHKGFLDSLETVGIPRSSLESEYPHVGRGKIWPTFVARITQSEFHNLKAVNS